MAQAQGEIVKQEKFAFDGLLVLGKTTSPTFGFPKIPSIPTEEFLNFDENLF